MTRVETKKVSKYMPGPNPRVQVSVDYIQCSDDYDAFHDYACEMLKTECITTRKHHNLLVDNIDRARHNQEIERQSAVDRILNMIR